MIKRGQAIPHLLMQCCQEHGLEKTSSLVDAIIGAPVGAVSARIAAKEENKDQATREGLIIGAILGFLAGQRAVTESMRGEETEIYESPAAAAAMGGAALGALRHR
jgi:hypothetical protein